MTGRPAVLHVTAPARVGGLESVVTSLTGGLAGRGLDVHVATVVEPGTPEPEFVGRMVGSGVATHRVSVPRRAYHSEVREIRDLVGRIDPDLVHTHGYRADVVAGTVARFAGVPTVSTVHGFTGGGPKNRFYEWLQRRALRGFDAVVAVARPIRRILLDAGVPEGRVYLVPNAWSATEPPLERDEARRRLGLRAESFVVGWVGRLSSEKGPHDLLAATGRLDASALEVSVLGDGPLDASLRDAAESGRGPPVHLHGRVPHAAALFRAFDVFVLSSRTEGTPVALFEAMAAGVPVVSTRVGGVPDVVRHGEEALLVPAGDPAALAAAVSRIRSDPDLGRELTRRARRRLEGSFAAGAWLDRYEAIYTGVARR